MMKAYRDELLRKYNEEAERSGCYVAEYCILNAGRACGTYIVVMTMYDNTSNKLDEYVDYSRYSLLDALNKLEKQILDIISR